MKFGCWVTTATTTRWPDSSTAPLSGSPTAIILNSSNLHSLPMSAGAACFASDKWCSPKSSEELKAWTNLATSKACSGSSIAAWARRDNTVSKNLWKLEWSFIKKDRVNGSHHRRLHLSYNNCKTITLIQNWDASYFTTNFSLLLLWSIWA